MPLSLSAPEVQRMSTTEREFQREGSCCVSLGFPWEPKLWNSIWLILRACFLFSGRRLWGRHTGTQLFLCSPQRLNIPHSCPCGGCPVWRSTLPRRSPEAAVLRALSRCAVALKSSALHGDLVYFLFTLSFFPSKNSILSILNYLFDLTHLNYEHGNILKDIE